MTRLTVRDVADRAGVSIGTVSHVLNRPEVVAEGTRQRVLAAIDDLGYVRNNAARQLRGIRSPAIALIVLDFDNPFFTEIARGVEQAAARADHLVILASSGAVAGREDTALRLLEEQRVAGILVSPARKGRSARLREIRSHGTPVVLLDRRSSRDQCSVAINDTSGGRQVAEHLLSLGHTDFGIINGRRSLKPCAERREGFFEVLEARGIRVKPADDIEMDAMTVKAGEAAMRELLGGRSAPTAVFCGNDLMAIGAERAAIGRGARIPEDMALVGYDDISFAESSLVPLTSVRNPGYDLGYQGATLLLDEVTNSAEHRHQRVLFEPELVVRASTIGAAAYGFPSLVANGDAASLAGRKGATAREGRATWSSTAKGARPAVGA